MYLRNGFIQHWKFWFSYIQELFIKHMGNEKLPILLHHLRNKICSFASTLALLFKLSRLFWRKLDLSTSGFFVWFNRAHMTFPVLSAKLKTVPRFDAFPSPCYCKWLWNRLCCIKKHSYGCGLDQNDEALIILTMLIHLRVKGDIKSGDD